MNADKNKVSTIRDTINSVAAFKKKMKATRLNKRQDLFISVFGDISGRDVYIKFLTAMTIDQFLTSIDDDDLSAIIKKDWS